MTKDPLTEIREERKRCRECRGIDRLSWRVSSVCASNSCVSVTRSGDDVLVRDTKHPDGPVLSFTLSEWSSFVEGVAKGEFDAEALG